MAELVCAILFMAAYAAGTVGALEGKPSRRLPYILVHPSLHKLYASPNKTRYFPRFDGSEYPLLVMTPMVLFPLPQKTAINRLWP